MTDYTSAVDIARPITSPPKVQVNDTIRTRVMTGVYHVQIRRPAEELTDKDNFHITGESGNWIVSQNQVKVCPWICATIREAEAWIQFNA